jgi:hypothetical protein
MMIQSKPAPYVFSGNLSQPLTSILSADLPGIYLPFPAGGKLLPYVILLDRQPL